MAHPLLSTTVVEARCVGVDVVTGKVAEAEAGGAVGPGAGGLRVDVDGGAGTRGAVADGVVGVAGEAASGWGRVGGGAGVGCRCVVRGGGLVRGEGL